MNKISKLIFFTFLSITSMIAMAQSCETYQYDPIETTIEFEGGGNFRLISTASVPVTFDDRSEIISARREADLIAKRGIAEYINQKFLSEDNISSEITKSKTNTKAKDGSIVSAENRDEIKKQLSVISTRSDAVLKGIITIASCYSKGREVRVTVGIKSEGNVSSALGTVMGSEKAKQYIQPNEK